MPSSRSHQVVPTTEPQPSSPSPVPAPQPAALQDSFSPDEETVDLGDDATGGDDHSDYIEGVNDPDAVPDGPKKKMTAVNYFFDRTGVSSICRECTYVSYVLNPFSVF